MVYFIAFVREAEALEGVRARDRHRVRGGAGVLPGNGAWQGGGGGEREKSSEWKEEEPCTMEGVRDEVGEGRRRGEGHGRREGREVGIRMAQMRDKSRAELYGVFMAVVRVLFGSEKGGREGTVALYSPPRGTRWHLLQGGDDLDRLLKGLGWWAAEGPETMEGSEKAERQVRRRPNSPARWRRLCCHVASSSPPPPPPAPSLLSSSLSPLPTATVFRLEKHSP